ncbi:PREDICTED: polyphenol oxidase [Prunus dulcis]|uniref:PREDICTED: polyphenol oxidase n=1 Tax=Prunus dulcis TaxID=3755 RepID=A0A5E4F653_PRUDU|nr:polyphenol oxidase latent form, chloroplastic-like [Prunus dulcis]VVA23564.1 PREDICTED: polyphenol oxidase [Prunus dulcis]
MAFSPSPPLAATIIGLRSTTTTSLSSFLPNKPHTPSLSRNPKQCLTGRVRCKATNGGDDHLEQGLSRLDRRNMLIGLGAGGLYGATGLENNPFAFAAPVSAPNLTQCGPADKPDGSTIDCCPPIVTTIIDFKLPDKGPLRTRLAAQDVAKDPVYLAKYKKAIALMRALPDDDPRSFAQQAKVHCSYCDGGYPQVEYPDLEIQVHFCWLFYPFHRWYLYFFEKIMGELIGDPTFALPFWNWDAPAGMYIPEIFTDTTSSLYDQYRNAAHQPPKLLDLNYGGTDDDVDDTTRIKENLTTMYQQMVSKATSHRLFYGEPYSAGDDANPGAGNIESIPHNNIHLWTGDPTQTNGENMGAFYSAGRDPLFYAHHSNVDRMWSIYKSKLGGTDIEKKDYLDAEFLFYDEKKNLVRVKVRDSLDTTKLGYVYDNKVEIPWLTYKPTARKSSNKRKATVSSADLTNNFPATLTDTISVEVARTSTTKRTSTQKKAQDEVLVISGIKYAGNETVKFDVYVNDDAESLAGKDKSEFAGSFIHVPHKGKKDITTTLRLSITKLLEELDAETDSSVVVTLVPKVGTITIGGVSTELINTT